MVGEMFAHSYVDRVTFCSILLINNPRRGPLNLWLAGSMLLATK